MDENLCHSPANVAMITALPIQSCTGCSHEPHHHAAPVKARAHRGAYTFRIGLHRGACHHLCPGRKSFRPQFDGVDAARRIDRADPWQCQVGMVSFCVQSRRSVTDDSANAAAPCAHIKSPQACISIGGIGRPLWITRFSISAKVSAA